MESFLQNKIMRDSPKDSDLEALAQNALEYLRPWMKSSRDFTFTRSSKWKLLEDLYNNRRDLSSWNARGTSSGTLGNLQIIPLPGIDLPSPRSLEMTVVGNIISTFGKDDNLPNIFPPVRPIAP